MENPTRRRIDRVTAEDFLADMDALSAADLRTMRDDCREEEEQLSYARRVLLGQLDILQGELNTRGESAAEQSARVEAIVKAFGEGDQAGGSGMPTAHREMYQPLGPSGRRRGDMVLEDVPLGNLADMSDDEITALIDKVSHEAEWITSKRRVVLDHLDALQQELVLRYRAGSTTIADIVTT